MQLAMRRGGLEDKRPKWLVMAERGINEGELRFYLRAGEI